MTWTGRILMLTNAVAPDKLGGLERYVRELSAALVSQGCEVSVLSKRLSLELPYTEVGSDGVRIIRHDVPLKTDPAFALRYPFSVARAISRELDRGGSTTVVHGHFTVTSLAAAFRRRLHLYTFHAPVFKELLSERQGSYMLPKPLQRAAVAALRQAEASVVRSAQRIVVLSDFMRDEVIDLSPASMEKVMLLPGGVDTTRFSPGEAPPDDWAADAEPLLVTARRLTPRTGVQQLVEAMPRVRASLPRAKLAVLGDGGQRPAIEAAVDRLGLNRAVRLLGRVSEQELVHWYRRASLVVTPTQQLEGFGLTTAESMACGTPALVTPVGANPEVARLLSERLVAAGATPEALARAIVDLSGSPADLENLRGVARAAVHPAMSWDSIAAAHREIYGAVKP